MTDLPAEATPRLLVRVRDALRAPDVAAAFARTAVGAAVFAVPIRATMGETGWLAILIGLALLGAAALVARGRDTRSPTILPITVWIVLGWAAVSLAWTLTPGATVVGLIEFGALGLVGIALATVRDQVQLLRTVADVLRLALGVSLALEVLSGVILDTPFEFLGIEGRIAELGPIQGVAGASDRLGVLAVIAIATFGVEWFTRAVTREVSIASVVLAAIVLAFTRSGVALIVIVVCGLAALLLVGLRRVGAPTRRIMQWTIAGALGAAAAIAWIARRPLINALDSSSTNRDLVDLWQSTWSIAGLRPVAGWGWVGAWDASLPPYRYIAAMVPGSPGSAANAPLDVLLQLGLVGLVAVGAMAGLALVRTWRLASDAKPVVAVWPALVLAALGAASLAESLVLVDWGWLLLVIGAGIGSRRGGLGRAATGGGG